MAGETPPVPRAPEDTPGAKNEAQAGGARPGLREVIEKLKHNKNLRELIAAIKDPRTGYNRKLKLARRVEEELGIPVYLDSGHGDIYCSAREPIVLAINIDPALNKSWWLEVFKGGYGIITAEEVYLYWGED